ncbi:CDP-glucose 4,6-dehydratase [Dissulfurispira thermophila]|uniref:CDP-glucose 4,6-dehydratase n=2 Tax=root TaxID=1 RepID=A0A7G1H3K8_9BACT|nr:CDP-glucose 4,6-dehydratase [Dissulfurispira thermophila]BCB96307.1 CDP-glucose 4,6-dehydratase [Dissulfurispira thermophila]
MKKLRGKYGKTEVDIMLREVYKNRTVFVTGHTGFKGSWLTIWLLSLGAKVVGYSLYLPSDPCNFVVCNLKDRVTHIDGDIRNIKDLRNVFSKYNPDIVFHLAAQPIVRRSFDDPKLTFDTNVGGTINILECIRNTSSVKAAIIITSDKCYQNVEWVWGYRENDRLGGDDPYSASKACAEIVCNSYIKSFFSKKDLSRISTARAGNVIGGGDWAVDRIVPDCVRAFSENNVLEIRNPQATRPWQHVLEPLSGYLWLGANLLNNNSNVVGESFNFGPSDNVNRSVKELIDEFVKVWGNGKWRAIVNDIANKKEAGLLKLNCDKALFYLKWHAVLSFEETVKMTAEWYKAYYNGEKDMFDFSVRQIEEYIYLAKKKGLVWVE